MHDHFNMRPRWFEREASAPVCIVAILLAWATIMVWAAVIETPHVEQPVIHEVR